MENKEFILKATRGSKLLGIKATPRFENEEGTCEVLLSDYMDVEKGDKIRVTLEKLD